MRRKIIPYEPKLKELARRLRNNSTLSEVLLWKRLNGKQIRGYDFHRQKPINRYIVDFFCNELSLAIEIDGSSHEGKNEYDEERQATLKSLDVLVLRFSDHEVKRNVDGVVQTIEDWIDIHGHTTFLSQKENK